MSVSKKPETNALDANKIPIRMAQVHQPVNVPGVIGSDKTVTKSKYPGLQMSYTPLGLVLERAATRAIIPHANIAVAIIEEV